jgi:hypothetical protein
MAAVSAIVFIGPTLSPREAAGVLDAAYHPPAAQGDLYRAALQRPRAIGLIDGCCETVPAVWHNEILWAMAQGIHVFGAAGIGALRAVELAPFGMEGVGTVFDSFRDGLLDDDAEVAVLHADAHHGHVALSEALVNIRATLARAVVEGILSADAAAALLERARATFYRQRTWPGLLAGAAAAGLDVGRLEGWLPHGRVDRKRLDALAMLRLMRTRLDAGVPPKAVTWRFQPTRAWMTACHLGERRSRPEPAVEPADPA